MASCHHMTPLLHKNLASCTIQDLLSELYNLGILKPFTIPWLTINGLLKSIRTKAKLFKKFLNNSNSYHENVYKAVQNNLIYLIKDAKRNCNYQKLETSHGRKHHWVMQIFNQVAPFCQVAVLPFSKIFKLYMLGM